MAAASASTAQLAVGGARVVAGVAFAAVAAIAASVALRWPRQTCCSLQVSAAGDAAVVVVVDVVVATTCRSSCCCSARPKQKRLKTPPHHRKAAASARASPGPATGGCQGPSGGSPHGDDPLRGLRPGLGFGLGCCLLGPGWTSKSFSRSMPRRPGQASRVSKVAQRQQHQLQAERPPQTCASCFHGTVRELHLQFWQQRLRLLQQQQRQGTDRGKKGKG
mmetsp:Transcript_40416/g.87218  ORF Transcript_40416/g.87218 Transcript_40416/m.87218 type:complete len:220 (-) Transcript_40416:558-1217(-)